MADSSIEWTDKVWNPIRGCSKVSAGCKHCYAERQAARFSGPGQPYDGLVWRPGDGRGTGWTGEARFIPDMLAAPLKWRKPCRVFVNSMSDLFHSDITNEQIAAIFGVMAACPQHTFQVLTKRPQRMLEWFEWLGSLRNDDGTFSLQVDLARRYLSDQLKSEAPRAASIGWPLPNVHLGVSVENQAAADDRVPMLLRCPAAVRWVSAEPLLGAVDLTEISAQTATGIEQWNALEQEFDDSIGADGPRLDWVVCGGESGPNARPMHPEWAQSLRDQCRSANVPFFFKQWGEWQVASESNGWIGSRTPVTGERFTWLGFDGKTQNPSFHGLTNPIYAMARAGKKRAGSLLDGHEHKMFPGDKW